MARPQTFGAERGLKRLEGFADGVFAIAITLLFNDLKVRGPGQATGGLAHALLEQWRTYFGLVLSFVLIGIYWAQHHYTGRIYRKSDHLFGMITLVFLFGIVVAPFPLKTWAAYVGEASPADERTASVFAAVGLLLPALGWLGKWAYGVPGRRLADDRLEPAFLRRLTIKYAASVALLALAVPLAAVWPRVGVGLSIVVTSIYAIPPPKLTWRPGQEPDLETR